MYGLKVNGYEKGVINEREVRAGSAILFLFGLLALINSIGLDHGVFSKVYIGYFTFDMLSRIINPNYSPSLLLGRLFIQHLKPEYVGASQKRVAWGIAFVLSLPMFYTLTLTWNPTFWGIWLCIFCLGLMFLETAFSFCLGCWIYKKIKIEVSNCPGGSCELQFKDEAQRFTTIQKIILGGIIGFITYFSFAYFQLDNKTYFAQNVGKMFKTEKMIELDEQAEIDKAWAESEADDDWDEE
jgi:hypothetical protein